jgi:transposase
MPAIKTVQLSTEQRAALEQGWRHGTTFGFRQRCQMILLKAQKRTSKEVAQQVGCCEVVVNNWRKRYQAEGIEGLKTKKGRGRPAILQAHTDLEAVRRAVQTNRQRVSHAKAELEKELGKAFSTLTLKRFLKKTVAASNDCESA